jgi:hypothetical protein
MLVIPTTQKAEMMTGELVVVFIYAYYETMDKVN